MCNINLYKFTQILKVVIKKNNISCIYNGIANILYILYIQIRKKITINPTIFKKFSSWKSLLHQYLRIILNKYTI